MFILEVDDFGFDYYVVGQWDVVGVVYGKFQFDCFYYQVGYVCDVFGCVGRFGYGDQVVIVVQVGLLQVVMGRYWGVYVGFLFRLVL